MFDRIRRIFKPAPLPPAPTKLFVTYTASDGDTVRFMDAIISPKRGQLELTESTLSQIRRHLIDEATLRHPGKNWSVSFNSIVPIK